MKLIAHRGLILGPNTELENHPNQIIHAFDQQFECEIDLWVVNGDFMLGHDNPTYPINIDFLSDDRLWIHCKNHDALYAMRSFNFNYFWHQTDDITLTSHKYFWTYPGKPLYDCSIAVMPEWIMPLDQAATQYQCYGICSDYVEEMRSTVNCDKYLNKQ